METATRYRTEKDLPKAAEVIRMAENRVIEIACTSEEAKAKLINTLNVARFRSKIKDVHLRSDPASLVLEVVPAAVVRQRRKEEHQRRQQARHVTTWPGRTRHLQSLVHMDTEEPVGVRDYLMWVGGRFYPTRQDFIDEAVRLGCSKRIHKIPWGLVVGQSRIFLAHAEGAPKAEGRKDDDLTGYVFAFFVLDHIDLIVEDEVSITTLRDALDQAGVRLVQVADAYQEPERGCGHREVGALYAVSNPDPTYWAKLCLMAEKMASKVDVKGGIAVLEQPVPYYRPRFRAIAEFNAADYGLGFEGERPVVTLEEATARAKISLQPKRERAKRTPPALPAAPFEWRETNDRREGDIWYFCDADMQGFAVAGDVRPPFCPRCRRTETFAREGQTPPYITKARREGRSVEVGDVV